MSEYLVGKSISLKTLIVVSGVLLLILAVCSLIFGLYSMSLGEFLATFQNTGTYESFIVWQVRLPRVLMGMLIGAGIAIAGAVCQGVLRNDLATPSILGVSAGCTLAIRMVVIFSLWSATPALLPLSGFIGGMCVMAVILLLARQKQGLSPIRMLLIGMAVNAVLGAAGGILVLFTPIQRYNYLTAFLSSSLTKANWTYVMYLAPWVIIGGLVLAFQARTLNILSLGAQEAVPLGVRVSLRRLLFLVVAVAITAACVSLGGGFLFLGLIAPHISRRLVGSDYQKVLWAAPMTGAVLVLFADMLSRVFFPIKEIPTGVFISVLGAPYFLYLLVKSGRR